jgi:hypothetical protein
LLQFDVPEKKKKKPSLGIMPKIKSMVQSLTQFDRVDPGVFCPQKQQLTAEFSREKTYL